MAVAADNAASLNFRVGIPQNVPEKAMSGVAGVSLELRLEIGKIQKPGSGFAPIWSILIQFPHTGIMESEEKILRTAFLRMIAMHQKHLSRKELY